MDLVIAGLGNPGAEYVRTRHNIGFLVADRLAERQKCVWEQRDPLFTACTFRYARRSVVLLKPMTYMNLSGRAVKKILNANQLAPEKLIIVVDEFNFPVGRVQLSKGGSSGGHNGTENILQELGTPQFWRLRCGIGRDFGPGELVDYVLSPFPVDQHATVDTMIEDACDQLERVIRDGADRARG